MSDFLQTASVRIKRSNIASFGVAEREKDLKNVNPLGLLLLWGLTKVSKTVEQNLRPIRYLYVTTYQKDNYTFTEKEIDIPTVLAELEKA